MSLANLGAQVAILEILLNVSSAFRMVTKRKRTERALKELYLK